MKETATEQLGLDLGSLSDCEAIKRPLIDLEEFEIYGKYGISSLRYQAIKLLAKCTGVTTEEFMEAVKMLQNHSDEKPAYKQFYIPKKDGGKREIRTPIQPLKKMTRQIYDEILVRCPLNYHVQGFRTKRSIVSNARAHLDAGVNNLVNFDIKDCFPSTPIDSIRKVYGETFGRQLLAEGENPELVKEAVEVLAILATLRYGRSCTEILPMGTPTSPALLNLVLQPFDTELMRNLRKLERKHRTKFVYTRFGDDLSISSPNPLPVAIYSLVPSLLKNYGYKLNKKKTKVMERGKKPLEVTGLILGEGRLLLPDKLLRKFEIIIIKILHKKVKSKSERNVLRGIIGLVTMVYEGELAPRIANAIERIKVEGSNPDWADKVEEDCFGLESDSSQSDYRPPKHDYSVIQMLQNGDISEEEIGAMFDQ